MGNLHLTQRNVNPDRRQQIPLHPQPSSSANSSSSPSQSPVVASSPRGSVIVEPSVPTTPTPPPPPVRKPTPKQDELNNKVNIANEILVALYRKRELGQMSENHRNEIKIREANLKELKKKLHEAKLNEMRHKKLRDERKRKFEALDEPTRKNVTGKATSDSGRPEKVESTELIETICRIAISSTPRYPSPNTSMLTPTLLVTAFSNSYLYLPPPMGHHHSPPSGCLTPVPVTNGSRKHTNMDENKSSEFPNMHRLEPKNNYTVT